MFIRQKHLIPLSGIVIPKTLPYHKILDLTESFNDLVKSGQANFDNSFKKCGRVRRVLLFGEFRIVYLVKKDDYLHLQRCKKSGLWYCPLTRKLKGSFITIE